MSSGTAYDFRVRSLADQLLLYRGLDELVIPNETLEQSAAITRLLNMLEAVIGRRPSEARPKAPYRNRRAWTRKRRPVKGGALEEGSFTST